MDNWFTIDRVDDNTYIISEYRHWEETHCYLLNGSERSLLIDTGLGISNIYDEVIKFTNKPITAVATHIHWDHIGGHQYFLQTFMLMLENWIGLMENFLYRWKQSGKWLLTVVIYQITSMYMITSFFKECQQKL
ncbi:MBL fold metallo-hydrolase [Clostridioides difficile]|uniref:MBL fold metallo-hydrolase n=1 Tax=Clostridioides difficile TaxID=1496 RepID=UPI002ED22DC7